ncbi:hypothetical protein PLICRDRAFT_118239 [Plicaturopsis crispa FD-325 SS-3]|uniref:Uncharacterized protein n=1 Tax=Plicaturopsis crispa FD-325 SS-3 TaxID=944288 RepID=A0A0C9T543_PLICR|nr:hypothetical protein PLICRDRAFT_118239 [Plicaturopsis crispa FD-325 SS-3]
MQRHDEPILSPRNGRFILFPIHYVQLWTMYKESVANFWTPEDINLSVDRYHWIEMLTSRERRYYSIVFSVLSGSYGIVTDNIASRLSREVHIPEARSFYAFQIAMQNIHGETYSRILHTLIRSEDHRSRLLNSILSIQSIRAKAAWSIRWTTDTRSSFATRLVAFASTNTVFFSSASASLYLLKKRRLMPGVTACNDLVYRDSGLHTHFACVLHDHLRVKATPSEIRLIVYEAVNLEKASNRELLHDSILGLDAMSMNMFVEYFANKLMYMLRQPPLYTNARNPVRPLCYTVSYALIVRIVRFYEYVPSIPLARLR